MRKTQILPAALFSALVLFPLVSCTDDEPLAESRPVSLAFAAVVGDEPFVCGESYQVGAPATTFTPADLRLYLHDVTVVDAAGARHPLALEQDTLWQTGDVALLDFEDGSATCSNGSAATRTVVEGTATAASVAAVEFTIGVPEALNHANQAVAASPLNLTTLFWSWNAGYKFIRIDGSTPSLGDSFRFHLGSTACGGAASGEEPSCDRPNRATVRLDGINPDADVIAIDLAALFAGSNLDSNADNTAPGCMSELDDPDCAPMYRALGIDPSTGASDDTQAVFRVVSATN